MFSLVCVWIIGWVNDEADDLRRYRAHYDVIVLITFKLTVPYMPWLSDILYFTNTVGFTTSGKSPNQAHTKWQRIKIQFFHITTKFESVNYVSCVIILVTECLHLQACLLTEMLQSKWYHSNCWECGFFRIYKIMMSKCYVYMPIHRELFYTTICS